MLLSNICVLYPKFEGIFQKHVKEARFDVALRSSLDFKDLKRDVISLWHLQEKHGPLHPATRSDLVQALLVEHNFQRALQLFEKPEVNTNGSGMVTRVVSYFRGEEESFKSQMRTAASNLPDSQFLQRLESLDDPELQSTVRNAKALAQKGLSKSIGAVVRKMTHVVLAMQEDHCRMFVQAEVENEEMKVLDDVLVEFIREINTKSAARRTS
jgi:hypothetical protein